MTYSNALKDCSNSFLTSFADTLEQNGLALCRDETTTLQINVGRLCNLSCRHCHQESGPDCSEVMSHKTMEDVLAYVQRASFAKVDITGGAPELMPGIEVFIDRLAPLVSTLAFRTNLVALQNGAGVDLIDVLKKNKVALIASFPSLNEKQTASQRGSGVLGKSLDVLKRLNDLGYGVEEGLQLNLIANPSGAFQHADQSQLVKKFRQDLFSRHGIIFHDLFSLTNVPLGRFRRWLETTGNLDSYMMKLCASFNKTNVPSLMCRSQLSVSWDGYLYDCDFNLASGLGLGGKKLHVSQMLKRPAPDMPITTADHCYACTAGVGSSCGGSLSDQAS